MSLVLFLRWIWCGFTVCHNIKIEPQVNNESENLKNVQNRCCYHGSVTPWTDCFVVLKLPHTIRMQKQQTQTMKKKLARVQAVNLPNKPQCIYCSFSLKLKKYSCSNTESNEQLQNWREKKGVRLRGLGQCSAGHSWFSSWVSYCGQRHHLKSVVLLAAKRFHSGTNILCGVSGTALCGFKMTALSKHSLLKTPFQKRSQHYWTCFSQVMNLYWNYGVTVLYPGIFVYVFFNIVLQYLYVYRYLNVN